MKKKTQLKEIVVKSFVTDNGARRVAGGVPPTDIQCPTQWHNGC